MQPDTGVLTPAAGTLGDCTQPGLILPRLLQVDAAGIISELSQVLLRSGSIPDLLPFYQAALNQELMGPSVLGCGIAFPHARISGLKQLRFALGRTASPVAWGTRGAPSVGLIFLMAVPATDSTRYLQVLASLARLGQRPDTLKSLLEAPTDREMHRILCEIGLRQG